MTMKKMKMRVTAQLLKVGTKRSPGSRLSQGKGKPGMLLVRGQGRVAQGEEPNPRFSLSTQKLLVLW